MPRGSITKQREDSDQTELEVFLKQFDIDQCIPTGSTILNLHLSGNAFGGWVRGKMANVIGDSDAGKTLLCLTSLAEASLAAHLKNTDLYLDDAEESNEFDIENMFGRALLKRLKGPEGGNSETIEDFYRKCYAAIQDPCLYVLDSMDSLDSEASMEDFANEIETGKAKGSYGDGKAKKNSQGLRKLKAKLKQSLSTLLIISQTRENIGLSFAPKTRAGGKALKFYACWEIWLAVNKAITKKVRGVDRKIGNIITVKVSKNHATGRHGQFNVPIQYGYGIDDVRGIAEWLIAENWWKKGKGSLITKEFGIISPAELSETCQQEAEYRKLREVAQEAWNELEIGLKRKGRYA